MRVAIIGGGAAGMMCAATINEQNPNTDVILIEKNDSLGRKVLISGGGRCNVTTGIQDIKLLLKKYPRGGKFLTSAMYRFPPADVFAWFEEHGVPLKREDDLRVFPKSDRGSDVVATFEKIFAKHKTKILFNRAVTAIKRGRDGFEIQFKDGALVTADKIVLASGGQAYRQTGSSGDGYTLAESFGHHITPLAPSLHSFVIKERWPQELAGLSFKNATITVEQKKTISETGSFIFTHRGISGPVVFAISSLIAFEKLSRDQPLGIHIDLFPELASAELEVEIKKILKNNPKKAIKNALNYFIPSNFVEVICKELKIDLTKKCAEVSRREIATLLGGLKHLPLSIVGRGASDEFVTAGGVDLKEANPKTMESKLCSGLYFAGELLDIDGFTGGFNLQAAWATGFAAGESIANSR